ncbi:MAG TPA: TIR domain-containing protein [Candidatus Sulfotelmatobacter sp.]|nr:TIR domain-containing protein [Candidatus Sulfotelmatobacter sp.]
MAQDRASGANTRAIEIVFSYSHKDETLRDELEKHLSVLNRSGIVSGWHDRRITGGTEWEPKIDEHLATADVILLLVSPDFIASDYCYDKEMKLAIERHEHREARVIPVILRPCDWRGAPFGKLQGLPKDMRPVTSWSSQDEAFTDVAIGIRKVAEELRSTPRMPPSTAHSRREFVAQAPPLKTRARIPISIEPAAAALKWRPNPRKLLLEGPHLQMTISTTRPELDEGRAIGLEYRELAVHALIDTGASLTVINPQIASTCKLLQTDWNRITTVGGMAGSYPAYAAAISFPGSELPGFDVIRVVACPIIEQRYFSCLIGRDILRKWLFTYDGPNGEIEIQTR